MKKLYENSMFDNELMLDIDFSEFDKVVGFQAEKSKEEDLDGEVGVEVSLDDIEGLDDYSEDDLSNYDAGIDFESTAEELPVEEVGEEVEASPEEEEEEEEILNDSIKLRSLAEVYELRKSFKVNKLVESILVDSVVDSVYDIMTGTLRSHGISKANSIVVLGLLLDRMLKADDNEVARPEFLKDTLGDLLDNKDILDIVHKAVQDALEYNPNCGRQVPLDDKAQAAILTTGGVENLEEE